MHSNKTNKFNILAIKIFGFICLSCFIGANAQQVFQERVDNLETSYLESKDELEDYILGTGDKLKIKFIDIPELSGLFTIDPQGEIYFERIKYTYVRGLTISELTKLLEERYKEFLLNPEIEISIKTFKPIKVNVIGEVRSPGVIKLPSFASQYVDRVETVVLPLGMDTSNLGSIGNNKNGSAQLGPLELSTTKRKFNKEKEMDYYDFNNLYKKDNEYITTLSNVIQRAGGLTSFSDISKVTITRNVPIGKGGGQKRAIIDFRSYIRKADTQYDVRLFDGDEIFIPRLSEQDVAIIPKSILSGLSPRFINVSIGGQIENPGTVKIPVEGTLSDVMNLSGPRKPLSGKIYLIRYNKDGTLLREHITYSANASPGSRKNPYLLDGDLITIKNSILGRTAGTLKTVTEPFIGIYTTKETFKSLTE